MSWSNGLSSEQQNNAKDIHVHVRLLAGPGTGKTRTMTARIAYLIEEDHVSANEILALTFTRAAASELRKRLTELLTGSLIPQVSTLHSFALKSILQLGAGDRLPRPIRIADDYEEKNIIEEELQQILGLPKVKDARELIHRLSADWETLSADTDDWQSRFPDPRFLSAWKEHRMIYGYTLRSELVYQLKKSLEEGAVELYNPPKYVLVDEYQDLNACDLAVIKQFERNNAILYVAGDDDQSIYGFRKADPKGIRRFLNEYPGSLDKGLTECHRCGVNILSVANFVAAQDYNRLPKVLTPCIDRPGEAHLLYFNDYDEEAQGIAKIANFLMIKHTIPADKILVLLRSDKDKKFSEPIRNAFREQGIRTETTDNPLSLFDTKEGRILLSFLRLLIMPKDSMSWHTLIKLRPNNLGVKAIAKIYDIAKNQAITFYDALTIISENPSSISLQGSLIKAEFETINNKLNLLQGKLNDADNLSGFLEWIIDEELNFNNLKKLKDVLDKIISESAITSLVDLLQNIMVTIPYAEFSKTAGNASIMTMHKAKGLDAEIVFIAATEEEYIPGNNNGAAKYDELRLLYVSLTRARSFLYITYCNKRSGAQTHSGSTSGKKKRRLTSFLSASPLQPINGNQYIADLHSLN
ncbi:ATP-dependent helicase [Dehalococcoides mccartyi]|uniref:DNA 3'-5' helicase n=1 Tax=Dehalococcoides mccartyi TaxID=61435 RepID=A0AB38Z8K1_9CHLR|nr:ATP-dependent helicase [Dehalococcoides mccartyi]WRO06914.1 ATP-dependent helicase [Dehalococcoides mccartyi]